MLKQKLGTTPQDRLSTTRLIKYTPISPELSEFLKKLGTLIKTL